MYELERLDPVLEVLEEVNTPFTVEARKMEHDRRPARKAKKEGTPA